MTITGAPTIVRLPKKIKPEDITLDDLQHLSNDSFALWTQTSGVTVDNNPVEFNTHRYLLPIYMCNDVEIVWRKAAQLGATVYMLLKVIWWLHVHQGRKAGLYFPTKEGVENLSKDRLTPLLESIPSLSATIDVQDKLGLRRIGKSSFYLFHLGGVASKDSVPLDFVAFDEVRLCKASEIDQALERISHSPYKQKIFMSTAGMPSCFAGDTEVLVKNKKTNFVTKRKIKDLLESFQDYQVLSYNTVGGYSPRWRNILHAINRGPKRMFEVTLTGGHKIRCTADHKFAVADGAPRLRFDEIRNISLRQEGYQACDVGVVCVNKVPEYVNPERGLRISQTPFDNFTMKVFGIYAAEGSLGKHGELQIRQKKSDYVFDTVKSWAEMNNLPYRVNRDGSKHSGIFVTLGSREDLLEVFKSFGPDASSKQIPDSVLAGSAAQLEHFMEGFIAGDGTLGNTNPSTNIEYNLYTSSEQLVKDLCLIGLKIGKPLQVSQRARRDQIMYIDGVITGRQRHPAYHLAYNARAHRLEESALPHTGKLAVTRFKDTETIEDAYDLTIEGNSWFVLAQSGVLVHNSDIDARFELGTQHVWMAKCFCSDGVDLARTFPNCVVDDKKRGKLYLRCPKCKAVINDPQNGRYVSHNPGGDYTSFHVSQLTSKYISLKEIWNFYHRTTNKAEFYNAKLGLPFIDEENRGVGLGQLKACVDPQLEWAKPGKASHTAMGVDVGGGYCYVVIADVSESKKRIRHVEIIESENPEYMEAGKRVSPFKRLRQLMREYKVQTCVVDAMPNYDMVLEFAQEFPGKVFAAFYAKEAKDAVNWSDKPKTKLTLKKAGPLLKFKHYCVLSRYLSMDIALGEWAKTNVICPEPDNLVQMCFDEKTKQLQPEAVMNRAFSMFMRLVKQYHVTNEETGEGRHQWIYSGGDPHFAHAWNYCNVALERMRRQVLWTFG